MEASAPGQAGLHVVIMMEAARGPVYVGHEPVITPPLSVEASSAMASAWRSPTAPGKFFLWRRPICLSQQFINMYSGLLCQEDGGVRVQIQEIVNLFPSSSHLVIRNAHTFNCSGLHIQCHFIWEKCWLGVVYSTHSADTRLILALWVKINCWCVSILCLPK